MNETANTCSSLPMDRLLRPSSVAIVGASATPGAFGTTILANLESAGFAGDIYLVNPKRAEIDGRPCLSSVDDLPEGVDCAVLAIPRESVLHAVRACASRKIGAIIIFSAGFSESGPAGRADQQEIARIVLEHGIILEGPNCLGMVNYVDGAPLTFVSTPVVKLANSKGAAIVSQSGAMAAVLGVSLKYHAIPISFSISTGNEAARNVEDFVEYLLEDDHTSVLTLIVEQFRNPQKFLRLMIRARELDKRIVLLHPGRSDAARESAATHTGAMAGSYEAMRTKVSHAGVIVVETVEELIDVTQILFRCMTLPTGGAAVVTESGAFKALTLDFCESLDLRLPDLNPITKDALRHVLPDFALPTNPLDVTAQGLVNPDLYRRTLPLMLADDQYGSVVLAIILTDESTCKIKLPPILDAIRSIRPAKPVIFARVDEGGTIPGDYVENLRELGVCFFPSAERAFRALARFTKYSAAGHQVHRETVLQDIRLSFDRGVIPEYRSKEILSVIGITIPEGALARSLDEAQEIAKRIGFPVVLKAQSASLPHKSDAGGVALNVQDASDLSARWNAIFADVGKSFPGLVLDGVLIEKMGQHGIELIVGAQNDSAWGPVIMVGFGGVFAEIIRDVRLLPPELSIDEVIEELNLLEGSALFKGFRGSPALDVRAAAGIVCKLASLIQSTDSIKEAEINPVIVYPDGKGAVALDALIVGR